MEYSKREILKDLTRECLNDFLQKEPSKTEFTVPIKYENINYAVTWFKDVNVNEPKWSASFVEIKE